MSYTAGRIRLIVLLVFLAMCAIGGGASRPDVLSLLYLRPAAALALAAFFILPGTWDWRGLKPILLLFTALAAVIAAQLVPLPPSVWASLPGHSPFAVDLAAAGVGDAWRPMSLTPDLTRNSLLSLLPPFTILVGFAGLAEAERRLTLIAILIVMGLSGVVGILQVAGGANSPAYLYEVSHNDVPTGLFANRNHQAAFLAAGLPLLRAWTLLPASNRNAERFRSLLALGLALFLMVMILVTGSRMGMALAAFALGAAVFLVPPGEWLRAHARQYWLFLLLTLGMVVVLVLAVLFGRATAVDRLINADINEEQRLQAAPVVFRMIRDFFPWGSGFGSFDPLYRSYEPDSLLSFYYFNHAHNDLAELALLGGLPAVLVLAAFLGWFATRSIRAFWPWQTASHRTLFARAGAVVIAILLLASLVDYPLRTPMLGAVMTIACAWLGSMQRRGEKSAHTVPTSL